VPHLARGDKVRWKKERTHVAGRLEKRRNLERENIVADTPLLKSRLKTQEGREEERKFSKRPGEECRAASSRKERGRPH